MSHGHTDHITDAAATAKATGATVVGDLGDHVVARRPRACKNLEPMNKGGTIDVKGLRITMTDARHSSSFDENGIVYLGEAAGFVVKLENGQTIYFAGDTSLFGDMKLIGELYKPDIAFLPIGDRFTMGPDTAAMAAQVARREAGGADALRHVSAADRHAGAARSSTSRARTFEVLELKPGETAQ